MKARALASIAWPSFLLAGVAQSLFFTLFDPAELSLFSEPLQWNRTAVYSVGFFLFWAVCAGSSALTLLLHKGAAELAGGARAPGHRPAHENARDDS